MAPESAPAVETVYVIDDDPSMRRALDRMLRAAGFAVETYESAAAFLARDKEAPPCCAVIDVRMPALDGLSLHERLRNAGRTLPVVFITGDGDVPTSVRAMKTGAIDFIKVHRGRVMDKMGAGSLAALVRIAERLDRTK